MEHHAVIVLTLNNTQETVTFEEIREFELLSDETQEPLPDESKSGSCNIRFVTSLPKRFFRQEPHNGRVSTFHTG